jgi:hypothetical protein
VKISTVLPHYMATLCGRLFSMNYLRLECPFTPQTCIKLYGRAIVTSCYRLHRMEQECHEMALFDSSVFNIGVELNRAR